MNLPDYAKMDGAQAASCGITNRSLRGPVITRTGAYTAGYQDTHPDAMGVADGWTTAIMVSVEVPEAAEPDDQFVFAVRDPDLLAVWAAQLLDASIRLRRMLDAD